MLLATQIDIHDVEKYLPGLVDATRHWFKVYKMPDGKPANKFAFKGACKDKVSGACVWGHTRSFFRLIFRWKGLRYSCDS